MTILITSYDMNPQYVFGDKRVSLILAKQWKKWGHNVLILCYCPSANRVSSIEGIEQVFLPNNRCVYSKENLLFFQDLIGKREVNIILHQHAKIELFNRLCFSLNTNAKIISVIHFDIAYEEKVLARWFFSTIRNGTNVYNWVKDMLRYTKYLLYTRRKKHNYLMNLYSDIYNHSDCVSLLSPSYLGLFKAYVPNAENQRVLCINNPIIPIYTEVNKQKETIVLWVGRLEHDAKRLDYMLKIWIEINKTHPDWKLKILGSGDWDYWRKIIVQYHIKNAEVVGFCQTSEFYKKASIICMTSVTEGLPMVLLEAQQYGCVPMAYKSYAALDDIITDGENGYSIQAFDQKEYVTKLRRLMDDTNMRHRMALNGIESIKRFQVDKIAATWIAHFENLLGNHS